MQKWEEDMSSCLGVEYLPSLVIQMYLKSPLFLHTMMKIALLNSTAFLPGMTSARKIRQTLVLVFYTEETSCIVCAAERRNNTVGCSGSTCSSEVNKEGECQKAEDMGVSGARRFIKVFIRN